MSRIKQKKKYYIKKINSKYHDMYDKTICQSSFILIKLQDFYKLIKVSVLGLN